MNTIQSVGALAELLQNEEWSRRAGLILWLAALAARMVPTAALHSTGLAEPGRERRRENLANPAETCTQVAAADGVRQPEPVAMPAEAREMVQMEKTIQAAVAEPPTERPPVPADQEL